MPWGVTEGPASRPPAWRSTAIACVALLVIPIVGWLAIPSPAQDALPAATRPRPAAAPDAPSPEERAAPRERAPSRAAPRAQAQDTPSEAPAREEAPADAGAISGAVVDDQGQPVRAYTLAIESLVTATTATWSAAAAKRSKAVDDAAGAFAWSGLVPGRYILSASAPGRPPGLSAPIELPSNGATSGVTITLPRSATLVGTITDAATGRPVAQATVSLEGATTRLWEIEPAVADAKGAFSLPGVPEGPFSVRVEANGYRTRVITGLRTGGAPSLAMDAALSTGQGKLETVGVGALLGPMPAGVTVLLVYGGGPAERAGVSMLDRVTAIDGASTEGLTAADCTERLGGPEGSSVTLSLERDGVQREVTLAREKILR